MRLETVYQAPHRSFASLSVQLKRCLRPLKKFKKVIKKLSKTDLENDYNGSCQSFKAFRSDPKYINDMKNMCSQSTGCVGHRACRCIHCFVPHPREKTHFQGVPTFPLLGWICSFLFYLFVCLGHVFTVQWPPLKRKKP